MKSFFKKIIVSIITLEAKLVLQRYNPKIVAVTGNVGKTSTKDAIYTIMREFYRARKSEKSFNSEIGLPLTIIGLKNGWNNPFLWFWNIIKGALIIIWTPNYPEWLVLEVGADKPGDIQSVSTWLRSDIVILTRIADIPVHIEQFKDRKEVVKEKSYLIRTLKNGGMLILNNDDASIIKLKDKTDNRKITFGFEEGSDLRASNYHIVYENENDLMPKGIAFKVDHLGSNFPVRLNGIFGKQNVYTALAAFSVGVAEGLNFVKMIDILRDHSGPPGRFKPLHGIKNTLVVDDTYNSSPVALEVALQSFSELKTKGRKIAVLGDMLELGEFTEEAHKKIGKMIPDICHVLIASGKKGSLFADGALEAGMKEGDIKTLENSMLAADFAKDFVREGDIVLVKGSQGARMERVVEAIISEEKNDRSNLVRQDTEWSKR
jgi:UDP-N-acetylmuramoyl-tripeptide--D-alanyl-D-alanine ligase